MARCAVSMSVDVLEAFFDFEVRPEFAVAKLREVWFSFGGVIVGLILDGPLVVFAGFGTVEYIVAEGSVLSISVEVLVVGFMIKV